jgi:N4-gp56 family major capsid protein
MAIGNTKSTDALRQEIWAKDLYADVIANLYFTENGLMGKGANNIVELKDELAKEKGDTVTFGLTAKLSGDGVDGDDELEGNEEEINAYSEQISIDQKRFAVRLDGKLDEQKNAYDMRKDAKEKLTTQLTEFIERQIFLKLGGVTNVSLTDVSGTVVGKSCAWSNTPDYIPDADEAYTGNRYRYLNGAAASTASLATTSLMTPALISQAKAKAQLASPKIQPLRINGKNYYVMFIHPWQA